jgi:hypothetical protein
MSKLNEAVVRTGPIKLIESAVRRQITHTGYEVAADVAAGPIYR